MRKSLDLRPRHTPLTNWLNVNAPPEIQAFQLEAHRKQVAYEHEREIWREQHPDVPKERLEHG